MQYFKLLTLSLFLIAASGCATSTADHPHASEASITHWQKAVDYARANLPLEGELRVKSDGFGYLKVDDAYIHTLLPMLNLEKEGFKEPPYFRRKDAPGAHISVFYEKEHIHPKEEGQSFPFELEQIVIVKPSHHTSYVILQVKSPALEKLRQMYGLSPKLLGHEFHISIGEKEHRRK